MRVVPSALSRELIALSLSTLLFSAIAGAAPLSANLLEKARKALIEGQLPAAVVLFKGAWELTQDAEVLAQLARVNSMAGLFEEAIENYEQLLKLKPTGPLAARARSEIKRMRATPSLAGDQLFAQAKAVAEAGIAFKEGMRLVRQRRLNQAIPFLRAALVMDPSLPGAYRVLGGIYGKLGDKRQEEAFLVDYLRLRPDGAIADAVRARLASSGLLGKLTAEASLPSQIWVNGRPLGKVTPVAGLLLPVGKHTVSFVNAEYHIIRNMRVSVVAAKTEKVVFAFGVLKISLTPWARARAGGRDLGLWDAVGLPAGEHLVELEAHDGSRKKEVKVKIDAGKTVTISSW